MRYFQPWCATDELDELWCVEYDLIEEGDIQLDELRGVDTGQEIVQVFADPFELKICENREYEAYRGRRMLASPIRARSRDWNSSESDSRLINMDRAVTIASGEKYPE